jgi:hypothetical protein
VPGWLVRILKRIHEFAAESRYRLTYKALWEAESLGFAPEDVRNVLLCLGTSDSAGRVASRTTGEWMYVFKPCVGAEVLYVKLIVRGGCVVVSFHEDEGDAHEEDEYERSAAAGSRPCPSR